MLIPTGAILAGLALLVWGADRFVAGAAAAARNLGVSPLVVGLTVVGFGTSAPEILVSATASLQGNPGMAIGNALGSNIANIGLVLGATAVVCPVLVELKILRREMPLLLAISALAALVVLDGHFGRLDGLVLVVALVATSWWVVRLGLRGRAVDAIESEFDAAIPARMSLAVALGWLAFGLALLLVSSRVLVWGAVSLAQLFGVSDLVIGLTIVAVGTSLPELAASMMSALKNQPGMAIGNIIGSNMYNLLAVYSLPALIVPGPFPEQALTRDLPVMLALTVVLLVMGYAFDQTRRINRVEGVLLLAAFAGYQAWLYHASQGG